VLLYSVKEDYNIINKVASKIVIRLQLFIYIILNILNKAAKAYKNNIRMFNAFITISIAR
jgi:hypothetical protein